MKPFSTILIFCILWIFSHSTYSQSFSEINDNGFSFPIINLVSTTDTSVSKTPKIGQIVFNSNINISGIGANLAGYYVWQSGLWKKINSTMPSGTIVLSETETNPNLASKGFKLLYSFYIDSLSQTFYLYQKK